MNYTNVFRQNIQSKQRIIVNQGGTSSSKTWSILQILYLLAIKYDGILISVVAETMPHLKRGAMRDFFKMLEDENNYNENEHNKSDFSYQIKKSKIEFFSADNGAKVRGARRDYLFINECNNISYETFEQLEIRTKERIFLDFNPVCKFWAHDKVLLRSDVTFIKSTYLDNNYLSDNIKHTIESRKNIDANWWRIYGDGEIGELEGLIFNNFYLCETFPIDCKWVAYGLDFGFTNDPTTIVKVGLHSGELWIDELIYKTAMTNQDIGNFLKANNLSRVELIADNSEPKSIEEISQMGCRIEGCVKGKDSVINGIDIMKRYRINITKNSLNTINEFRNYSWKKDKNGKYINETSGIYDHCIDAIRYVVLKKTPKEKKITEIDVY